MSIYEFGCFSLNVADRAFERRGRLLRLPRRLFDILTLLVENSNRLVTKEELIEAIWHETIVEESNLTVAISRIRTLLRDDKRRPKYVVTVPRIGYRFIAEVRRVQTVNFNRVAVLPFQHDGPDSEHLADTLTRSLIYRLSDLPKLKVIPHSRVLRCKRAQIDSATIAGLQGDTSLVIGRITSHGDDVTTSVELLRGTRRELVWAKKYQGNKSALQAIEQDIVRKLTAEFDSETASRKRKSAAAVNEAFQLYLRGRFHWNKRSERDLRKSIEYFKRAIKKDQFYGPAYSGLADSYNMLGFYSMMAPRVAFSRAKAAASKAVVIDPSVSEAHASLGFATFHHDWNWKASERLFKQSLERDPTCLPARLYYGCLLAAGGRFYEAIGQYERALEIDPLSMIANAALGYGYYFARRFEDAIAQCRLATELDEHFEIAHVWLGWALEQCGMLDEAIVEYVKALALSGGQTSILATLATAFAKNGEKDKARRVVKELIKRSPQIFVSPYQVACIYAALEEESTALEWLETAYQGKCHLLVNLQVDPKLDALRSDRRFINFASRIVPSGEEAFADGVAQVFFSG